MRNFFYWSAGKKIPRWRTYLLKMSLLPLFPIYFSLFCLNLQRGTKKIELLVQFVEQLWRSFKHLPLRLGELMLTMIIVALITAILFGFCIVPVNGRRRRNRAVGFFHPYTNDGGGGERVLWCAVRGIQDEIPDLDCCIYTGDHDATPQSLMARALDRFGVTLLSPPKVPSFLILLSGLFFFCDFGLWGFSHLLLSSCLCIIWSRFFNCSNDERMEYYRMLFWVRKCF